MRRSRRIVAIGAVVLVLGACSDPEAPTRPSDSEVATNDDDPSADAPFASVPDEPTTDPQGAAEPGAPPAPTPERGASTETDSTPEADSTDEAPPAATTPGTSDRPGVGLGDATDAGGGRGGTRTDTDDRIEQLFVLQSSYVAVRCVHGDDPCPDAVDAAAPCVRSGCATTRSRLEVASAHPSLQAAVDASSPGELVVLMPGRHRGLELEGGGGRDGAYLHVLGLGELGDVVIDRPAHDASYLRDHILLIGDVHHVILQNLEVVGAERAGILVTGYFEETGSWAHHVVVQDVLARDNGTWGLHTTEASQLLVQDSAFTGSVEEHGVYVSNSGDDVIVRRNVFQGNAASGVQVNPDPFTSIDSLLNWTRTAAGTTCGLQNDGIWDGTVTWEDVDACYRSTGLPDLGERTQDGIGRRITIEENVATGNGALGGAGINLASLRDSVVRNNLVYGNDAAALACWDDGYGDGTGISPSPFGCHDVTIVSNTFVDPTGGRGSLILRRSARDLHVANNVIVRDRPDAYEIVDDATSGLRSHHNLATAQSVDGGGGYSGETSSVIGLSVDESLAAFVDPGFGPWITVGAGGWTLRADRPDFHPRAGSVLDGAGDRSTAPDTTLDGRPRTTATIGAYDVAG